MQQFMAYGIEPRMPQSLAYTTQEVEAILSQPGFHSIETYIENNELVYSSLDDMWEFILTLPIRLPIMGMGDQTRAKFKDEFFAKLRPGIRPDGLHVALGIVYALAKR